MHEAEYGEYVSLVSWTHVDCKPTCESTMGPMPGAIFNSNNREVLPRLEDNAVQCHFRPTLKARCIPER